MIHVITSQNRCLYDEALKEMHRLRRVHFVEERGWSAMTIREGGEYDAYDDDEAIYLLAIEDDASIIASMRMRPATSGSILADVFPHLLPDGPASIRSPDVWEISRYFASGLGRGRGGARRRAEIRLASLEVALRHGVSRLVGMIDIEVLPAMLDGSGWRVQPLGLPDAYPEGVAQAIEVEVSDEALADMQEYLGLPGTVALTLDPERHPHLPPEETEALLKLEESPEAHRRLVLTLARRLYALQTGGASEAVLLSLIERITGELDPQR